MEKQARISEAEWQVMKVLWARSPATANQVVEALSPESEWKPKTIMTLLNRLVKKGALGYEKIGRAFHYHPRVEEAECVRAESRSFLRRVYGGSLRPMLAHFIEHDDLSPADIKELKRLLDQRGE